MIVDNASKRVIGSGSLIIEKKFIRQLGTAGHIEDIVVQEQYRGRHLGLKIIELLKQLANINKCYKVILDCNQKNVGFYEKVSFDFLTRVLESVFRQGSLNGMVRVRFTPERSMNF